MVGHRELSYRDFVRATCSDLDRLSDELEQDTHNGMTSKH